MIDTLKPGQNIRCTIVKKPRARAGAKTIRTLMLRDPGAVKSLRRAQKLRRRNTLVYNRGNRDWVQRLPCAQISVCKPGETWTFTYQLDLADELKSVESYLKIEKA